MSSRHLSFVETGRAKPTSEMIVNRHWELVDANAPTAILTEGAAPALLKPPVNVLRLSLHPDGMAPRIPGGTSLAFISITAVIGTPMDITVDELAIESFYPADGRTAEHLGSKRS